MKIVIRNEAGKAINIQVDPTDTFSDLKQKIHKKSGLHLDLEQLNLKGKKPSDNELVLRYIKEGRNLQSLMQRRNIPIFTLDTVNGFSSCLHIFKKKMPDEPPHTFLFKIVYDCGLQNSGTFCKRNGENIKAALPPLQCIVPGCNNTEANSPNKTFFSFPLAEDRCRHWLLVCRRHDLLNETSAYMNSRHSVCSDHFIASQFADDKRQTLRKGAIPTLFDFNGEIQQLEDSDQVIVEENSEVEVKYEQIGSHVSEDESEFEDEELGRITEHPGQLCRLCASSISEAVYIFSSMGTEQQIAEKINTCLPVTVKSTDPLPKQLCIPCLNKLNMVHEFSELCIKAEERLRDMHEKRYFRASGAKENKSVVELLPIKTEHEGCTLNDGNQVCGNESLFCCPLCCTGNMAIQNAALDISDVLELGLLGPTQSGLYERPVVAPEKLEGQLIRLQTDLSDTNTAVWEDIPVVNAEVATIAEDGTAMEVAEGIYNLPVADNMALLDGESGFPACRLCGQVFPNIELCLDHAKAHTESDLYPCSLCELCFTSEICLISHCEEHKAAEVQVRPKGSKRLICATCGRRFNNPKTLAGHSCFTMARPYKCLECGKFFQTEARLIFHQKFHLGGNPVECEHCGKEFTRENNLFDHVRLVHMGEKAHRCDQCGKTFQLKARLVAHLRVHSGERPFVCDICGGKFYDNATLKGHRITHMDVKPFQCDKCGRCFARKTLFKQHALAHSEDLKTPKMYTCKLCIDGETYPSYARLLDHRKLVHPTVKLFDEEEPTVHTSKPFKCEDCGKSFAYRVTLLAHRRNHTGELPFACDYCEKRFSQKRSLVLHHRTHTGEKPFGCEVCGKRFVQSAHLYSHLRLHTGEKPYACDICGDKFRLKDVRDAHMRKHTGERPFKCSVCSKAFRTSHSYYQHMWIHQGKKPYPCSYCGKAFRRSNGLKIHIRIHTGEKPHSCDVCGRSFAQKQDMKKHRNLHLVGKL